MRSHRGSPNSSPTPIACILVFVREGVLCKGRAMEVWWAWPGRLEGAMWVLGTGHSLGGPWCRGLQGMQALKSSMTKAKGLQVVYIP